MMYVLNLLPKNEIVKVAPKGRRVSGDSLHPDSQWPSAFFVTPRSFIVSLAV